MRHTIQKQPQQGLEMRMHWIIPIEIKSGNKIIGRHWSSKAHYNKKIMEATYWEMLKDKDQRRNDCYAIVTVSRVLSKGQKLFDDDNLSWGFKPVFDCLKNTGWIKDDNPKWIKRGYKQVRGDQAGFIIEIEYVSSPCTCKDNKENCYDFPYPKLEIPGAEEI